MPNVRGTSREALAGPRFPSSKFRPPGAPSRLIHRPRLFNQLDRGEERRLTLVVGSPGAGKTVLLADWLAARPRRPSAWLSCDSADGDPARFFAAIIEAFRRAGHDRIGEDARQLLNLDGQASADVVASFADDLEREATPLVLVIDDAHLAVSRGVDALALLLDYRPGNLQLVLATRVDPQLRLHRMRANQELAELRDNDLSFSTGEAEEFFSGFGVRLPEPDLVFVHHQSEGWVAGLQMAALSMQDSDDRGGTTRRIDLRGRTVAGYFLEEVLYRQAPEVADFMLTTSVLDELSAAACTALCGDGAAELLERAYRANLFVILIGDDARTYRYHHLIRDVLRAELHARDPGRVRQLHFSAARYLAETGQVGPAARHLIAAGDAGAAFRLLSERAVRDFSVNPTTGSALDLDDVQPEQFAGAPEYLVPLAAELLMRGSFERGARAASLANHAGVDGDREPDLAIKLAFVNSAQCGLTGQLQECLAHRDRAMRLAQSAEGVDDWLAALDVNAMQCHTYLGDFTQVRQLAGTVAAAELGEAVTEVLCPGAVGQAALLEGALRQANELAVCALAAARRLGFERHFFAVDSIRTAALLALERRDIRSAERLNEELLALLGGGRPVFEYFAQLDRAHIWAAQGHLDEALASLPAARAALRTDRSSLFAHAEELEARLRLALGDRTGAIRLAEQLPDDRRLFLSAIIAVAAGDPQQAADAVTKLTHAATTVRADLEVRLLRANIAVMQTSPTAERLVKDVLTIVEREGFVQTVLDTAPQLVEHLTTHSERYPRTETLVALISAGVDARKLTVRRPSSAALPDPLTDAELRVLETLPLRLTYADMAADLHLSLNTVKTHLRHIYMKLGVSSRSAAVRRASALTLL